MRLRSSGSVISVQSSDLGFEEDLSFLLEEVVEEWCLDERDDIFLDFSSRSVSEPDSMAAALLLLSFRRLLLPLSLEDFLL